MAAHDAEKAAAMAAAAAGGSGDDDHIPITLMATEKFCKDNRPEGHTGSAQECA